MDSHQINIKAGVIKVKDELSLKRTIFRISRNNCFVMFAPYQAITDKMEKLQEEFLVFFLLFSGLKGGPLDRKLDRLVSSFSAQNYYIPQNSTDYNKYKK